MRREAVALRAASTTTHRGGHEMGDGLESFSHWLASEEHALDAAEQRAAQRLSASAKAAAAQQPQPQPPQWRREAADPPAGV